jgi:hypothetical protein
MEQHPGWFSPELTLRDPERLARAGADLAATVIAKARAGHNVWVLIWPTPDVNDYLFRHLDPALVTDEQKSRADCGVICLKPR